MLFIVCSGCTSKQEGTPPPATQTLETTETHTAVVTPITTPSNISSGPEAGTQLPHVDSLSHQGIGDQDTAFNVFFVKSQAEIVNKTNSLLEALVPGTMTVQAVYSPSLVYVRAEDLGFRTEKYYDQVLKTNTPETELKRIAYLQFLNSVKSSAYHFSRCC